MGTETVNTVGTVIKDSYLEKHRAELVSAITYLLTEPGEEYTFSKLTSLNHVPEQVTIKSKDLRGKELKLLIGVILHELELKKLYFYNTSLDYTLLKTQIKDILKELENDRA